MRPLTVSTTIDVPREQLFGYLADVANHAEFTDHFLKHWHLTREDSYGRGAGARFHSDRPRTRYGWEDVFLAELDPPREIVAHGRGGMFNRVRVITIWRLETTDSGATQVEVTHETVPATTTDRMSEALGARGWTKRQWRRALRRLRSIAEDDRDRGARPTISGGPRKPASAFRFGGHV